MNANSLRGLDVVYTIVEGSWRENHLSAQWSSRNNKVTFSDETALDCKFWDCIGWWVLSSSQCGHIINLGTLEHTENGNYQIWWCQLSKFAREYRVKSSYNLSFTLVWSRHYSNSQEATKYSYWIAFISSFSVLLAEKKLDGHKNSKCVCMYN